jgi:Transposase DDE domain
MGLTMVHESWTNRVFSTHFPSSGSRVSSLRGTLPWRLPPTRVFLLGPVLMYGFRTVHLSRELARCRSMFAVFACQALPHGHSGSGFPLHSGRCQRNARLAHLRRFRAAVDRHRSPLYVHDPIGVDLDQSLYALASTTIDLCLSLFPWAKFRKHKAAVKMHTLLDLHGNIPTFIRITDGKVHDVNILDEIMPEAGAFYVMDRGYIDFERLFVFTLCSAFFVVRTKENVLLQRRYLIQWTRRRACDPITPSSWRLLNPPLFTRVRSAASPIWTRRRKSGSSSLPTTSPSLQM